MLRVIKKRWVELAGFGLGFGLGFALVKTINGPMCKCEGDLLGKTVVITGANSGIGLETAVELSNRGARVIMACRNEDKGRKAVAEVLYRSHNKDVHFSKLDLASLKSVREFSSRILAEEPHVDILINNAGVSMPPYSKTEDGFELQIGVNHLGHFLLTNLLLERLKEAPAARVVNVSSVAHRHGKINFDDLHSEKTYKPFTAYRQSKLANIIFTKGLAKKLEKTNVVTCSLHPGVIQTHIMRHTALDWVVQVFGRLSMRSPLRGAQTTVHCAVSEHIAGNSGQYYANCKIKKLTNPQAMDTEVAERLWQVSAELVGLHDKKT